jgi:hypothetical protein
MGSIANEKVIEGVNTLTVVQGCLCHRQPVDLVASCGDVDEYFFAPIDGKGKQDSIDSNRIGIERDEWLVAKVFCGVDHQSVLAEDNDKILWTEKKIR